MSKSVKRIDSRQMGFEFDRKIEEYAALKEEILAGPPPRQIESYEEACIAIAAAAKRAIRTAGLKREQAVDAINEYFGWSGQGKGLKRISIHMLNHYLSKPVAYPMPASLIFAIQHITGSLELTRALAESADAQVISRDEVRQMTIGKLDETIIEMQRLKKELRGKR